MYKKPKILAWQIALAALLVQALCEGAWAMSMEAAWDFLRYAWLPVLLAAVFWERVFRDWLSRGLFHWLSLVLQGQVWALMFLTLGLLLLALLHQKEPMILWARFQMLSGRILPLGLWLSLATYFFKRGERGEGEK